jgi:hypothetical protein
MSERALVFQNLNLGVETTPGTPVAVTKRLPCIYAEVTPDIPVRLFRPQGMRFGQDTTLEKEMSGFRYEGAFGFNDLTYILSSLLGVATGTWTFLPAPFAPDTVKAYTFGIGTAAAAEGFSYGIFNSLSARFSKTEASLSGDGFGKKIDEAFSVGAVTDLVKSPASPKKVSVYLASSTAGLAAGKLTRCLSVEWYVRNMFGQLFTLDEAEDSFSNKVNLAPEIGMNIVLAHDSVSKGVITDMRAQTQKFARIIVNGRTIGAGPGAYKAQITMPIFAIEPRPSNEQGVVGRSYNFAADYESGLGSAIEVVLTNEVATL